MLLANKALQSYCCMAHKEAFLRSETGARRGRTAPLGQALSDFINTTFCQRKWNLFPSSDVTISSSLLGLFLAQHCFHLASHPSSPSSSKLTSLLPTALYTQSMFVFKLQNTTQNTPKTKRYFSSSSHSCYFTLNQTNLSQTPQCFRVELQMPNP